ncbi:MAG: class II aldolase/adducin family protein [Wenzhouxiangellaceae bacterium]|nr:class II aldolase/adducin family protein [Wenzhouxiangellaceae bacterium]MBS3747845.1 class II aldolase/adducin family protein [Wenzhouxiangellaceae bacterium]
MIDEGYTKYTVDWHRAPALPAAMIVELNDCRNRLYAAGLVGYYEAHGVGFGNVSILAPDGRGFIISGTGTGEIAHTDERHYSWVTDYDIDANRVVCHGPVQASSEALTHAAIYELDSVIRAVVHVHSAELWQRLIDRVPTTAANVPYGTPEMSREFVRLYRETDFVDGGVVVMAGHEEGIVACGADLKQAEHRILKLVSNGE